MIKLDLSRSVLEWLCIEVFPDVDTMATACINMYEKNESGYWSNVIVKFVLHSMLKKFYQKVDSNKMFVIVKMEEAEAICLYRFLFNFPITTDQHWKTVQRQFIIDELHKQIIDNIVIS